MAILNTLILATLRQALGQQPFRRLPHQTCRRRLKEIFRRNLRFKM